jgi:hypothetical protein
VTKNIYIYIYIYLYIKLKSLSNLRMGKKKKFSKKKKKEWGKIFTDILRCKNTLEEVTHDILLNFLVTSFFPTGFVRSILTKSVHNDVWTGSS